MTRQLALILLIGFACNSAYAGLFDDDVARNKITEQQAEISRLQDRVSVLEASLKSQGLLDLFTQLEVLNVELNKLRGQIEILVNENETLQKRQKDFYTDLDSRLKRLEQPGPSPAGPAAGQAPAPAEAKPAAAQAAAPAAKFASAPLQLVTPADPAAETRTYDAAYNQFAIGNYAGAVSAFQNFLKTYPASNLVPAAQYWIGNSYYALRDFKSAIASQQKLVSTYPASQKAPDAMLNIASSQQELNDISGAKKTLEELVAKYPISDAAEKAKRRLANIR